MDRRVEILNYIIDCHPSHGLGDEEVKIAIGAMDDYMKECCLELLEYIAKKVSNFWINDDGEARFRLSGDEELSKEQLFENFL